MATFEITGPDGAVYEISAPDDATEEQAFEYFKSQYRTPPKAEAKDTRSSLDQFSDMMYQGSASAIDSLGALGAIVDPSDDSIVAGTAGKIADTARSYMTPFAQERSKKQAAKVQQAESQSEGMFSGLEARLENIVEAPGDTAARVIGSTAVPIVGGIAAGAKAIGTGVAALMSGGIGAGSVRQNYYDTIKNTTDEQLIAENPAYAKARKHMTEKDAKEVLGTSMNAKLAAGMGTQAAIDSLLTVWGGAEKAILMGSKKGVKQLFTTTAKEAVGEAASGADEQLQTNIAVQDAIPSTPIGKAVGSAGVESGLLGAPMGAGAHIISPKKAIEVPPENASDLEAFKKKAATEKSTPAADNERVQIPIFPADLTEKQADGTLKPVNPADNQPVMAYVGKDSQAYKDYLARQEVGANYSADPQVQADPNQISLPFRDGPPDVDPNVMPNAQPPAQGEMFQQMGPPDGMPPGQISPNVTPKNGQGELFAKQREPRGPNQPKTEAPIPDPQAAPEQQMDLFSQVDPTGAAPLPADLQPTYLSLIGEDNGHPKVASTGGNRVRNNQTIDSISGKTPQEAFARLSKTASSPTMGYIFERIGMLTDVLAQLGITMEMRGVPNLTINNKKAWGYLGRGSNKLGLYYENKNLDGHSVENTLAHEGIHAVTSALIDANQDPTWRQSNKALSDRVNELEDLFETAKTVLRKHAAAIPALQEATANLHEFVAYGLTSPSIIKALKLIPSNGTNLLMDFIRKLGNLLGFRPNDFNLHARLMAVFDDISRNPDLHTAYKSAYKVKPPVNVHAEYARLTGVDEYKPMSVEQAKTEMDARPWDIDESKIGRMLRSGMRHLAIVTNHPMIKATHTAIDKALSDSRNQMRRIMGNSKDSLLSFKHKIPKHELPIVMQALLLADRTQTNIDYDDFPSLSKASRDFMQKNRQELERVLEYHNKKAVESGNESIDPRAGYTPATFGGRNRAMVTVQKDGVDHPIGYIGENTDQGYKKAEAWVKKNHPNAKITKLPPRKSHSKRVDEEIDSFVDMIRNTYGKVDEQLLDAARQMDNRLFGMDKRERGKLGIWGADGNKPWADMESNSKEFYDSLFNYYDEAYTHAALQPALKDIREMRSKYQDVAPNAVVEIDSYIRHVTGRNLNDIGAFANNLVDGVMATVDNQFARLGIQADSAKATSIIREQLTTLALGWFNTQYLMAQLMQPFQTALPFAKLLTNRYGISDAHIASSGAKALYQFGAYQIGAKVKPDTREVIQYAIENGLTGQSHIEHKTAVNKSKFNRAVDTVGGSVIRAGDSLTRFPAFLFYVDLLRQSPAGKSMDLTTILDTAKNLTQYSMVDYNPEQRPQLYAEMGFAGSLLGTFRTYQHGNISQIRSLAKEARKGDISPLFLMMAVLFALGGASGLPFVEEAEDALKWSGSGLSLKEVMLKHLPPEVSKGYLSAGTGYDLSSKYAFNRVIPDQFPMAHVQQAYKPIIAALELLNNDMMAYGVANPQGLKTLGKELLPNSLKNVFDTEVNLYKDSQGRAYLRGKDGTAAIDLSEEDVKKRESLAGFLSQAKPLDESIRRQIDFINSNISKQDQEKMSNIKKKLKEYLGQDILMGDTLAQMTQEYIELGGTQEQLTAGLEKYMEEKDLPYIMRGIEKGRATRAKLRALDNKYRK